MPHVFQVYLSIEYKGNITNFKAFKALFKRNLTHFDLARLSSGVL